MKHLMITAAVALLAIVSCKKADKKAAATENYTAQTEVTNDNGKIDSIASSSLVKNDNGELTEEYSLPYIATDGSRAKATFINKKNDNTITIEANNNKFQLDKKKVTPNGAIYERNGISAETKGDSLFITQGNTIIPLYRAK